MLLQKVEYHARKMIPAAWQPKKFRMQPEFTNHCNFKCTFCPHSVYRKDSYSGNPFDREKGYMSEELFEVFLQNAHRHASSVVIGYFGEQMLHPKFEDFLRAFPKRRPYELVFFSNWSRATAQNMETLKVCDDVRISIDASTGELWEQLCPGGAVVDLDGKPGENRYDTLVEKIKYWLNLPGHPRTRLKYVVSSVNEHDRETFLLEWLPRLSPQDSIVTKSVISYGGVMGDAHMRENPCQVPDQNRLTVAWNGDCSPCNLDVNVALRIGNLRETPDMSALFKQDLFKTVREGMRTKTGICANCFDANNHTESKEYFGTKDISPD